jgi:fucose 4-O-acetylase-like acetyltransferase
MIVKKRQEIELLRICSAFGIVWYHSVGVGRDIAYAGLVAFLIISMYFAAKAGMRRKRIGERARALLLPWLVWFLIYGAINVAGGRPFVPTEHGVVAGVLAGSSIHLWYLPFIFMAMVSFDHIKEHVDEQALSTLCIVLAAALLLLSGVWRGPSLAFDYPYAQYAHALDGVLIGVFFANCSALPRRRRAALIGMVLLVLLFALPTQGVGVPYLVGVLAVSLVLLPKWERFADLDVSWLADCTLGIYLSHALWLRLLKKYAAVPELLLPFLVFALAALGVWCFRRLLPGLAKYMV